MRFTRFLFSVTILLLAGCDDAPHGHAFSYDGQELHLRLKNGSDVMLRDGKCDSPETCLVHKFQGIIADDEFYLIDIHAWESAQFELISYKSGANTVIYGEPHLSPQQKYLVTAVGVENDYTSGVYLFEIADGEAKEVFRYKPEGYALYRFDKWVGENKAIIELTTICRDNGNEWLTLPVTLSATPEGWQLDQGRGAECIQSTKPAA